MVRAAAFLCASILVGSCSKAAPPPNQAADFKTECFQRSQSEPDQVAEARTVAQQPEQRRPSYALGLADDCIRYYADRYSAGHDAAGAIATAAVQRCEFSILGAETEIALSVGAKGVSEDKSPYERKATLDAVEMRACMANGPRWITPRD